MHCGNVPELLMTFERMHGRPSLAYELWKVQLRKDCEKEEKLLAFYSIGDYTLKMLWESGLAPTVQAIGGSIAP